MSAAAVKIASRITAYRVAKDEPAPAPVAQASVESAIVAMSEKIERPEVLVGSTYKIKTPVSDHAMYVTINDVVLNEGTPHEQRRPFEMFINSKNLEQYQWIVAMTRIISAVFRKGGDVTFLVDEMKAVFDPKGGYWQSGGQFMPSVIAELGHVVERHFKSIGLIKSELMDSARKKLIEEKRAQLVAKSASMPAVAAVSVAAAPKATSPAAAAAAAASAATSLGGQMCPKCFSPSVIKMDGCNTCLSCGDSKCG